MIYSGIFNSVRDGSGEGDRKYNAWWFAKYFSTFIGNGVFPNPSTNLQVVENANMTVTVKPGSGWIDGYFIYSDSENVLQLDVADGILKRIDRIVMRLNYLTRQIEIAVKKGSLSSSPVAASLQNDTDYHELALADVLITNGSTQITQANITDTRINKNLCGIVSGTVNQVDTTTLFNQYQSWINQQKDLYQKELELWTAEQRLTFEQWMSTQNSDFSNWRELKEKEFIDWMFKEQQDFNYWFQQLKDVLDENAETKILNKILELENGMNDLSETVQTDNQLLTEHLGTKNPHGIDSEIVNIINRANLDASTSPMEYPIGISLFYETRTTQATTWRIALGLPFLKTGFRLKIQTEKASPVTSTSVFGTVTQTLTYLTSLVGGVGAIEGIYIRSGVYINNGDGTYTYYWGPFIQQMTSSGGEFKGIVKAFSNSSYDVPQIKNILLSKSMPTVEMVGDGDICLVYEE